MGSEGDKGDALGISSPLTGQNTPATCCLPLRGFTLELDHLNADLEQVQEKDKKWSEAAKKLRIFLMSYRKASIPHSCTETVELLSELQGRSSDTPCAWGDSRACLGKENPIVIKAAEISQWTGCIFTILHLYISAFGIMVSFLF